MKIFGFERDNTTFQSTPDESNKTYRTSFELYPFHEGKDHAVYKGMMNGNGPKLGRFCVVKARLDGKSSKEDWEYLLDVSKMAQYLASVFHTTLGRQALFFTKPLIAQMDSVSDFARLLRYFKPHDKKLSKGEYVVLEDFIEGTFVRFSTSAGVVNPSPETGLTEAYSHFSWHQTRDLVVCGLQGVREDAIYELTSPSIHSLSGRFGPNDCRWPGICEFFSNHRCNNICFGWHRPDVAACRSSGLNQMSSPCSFVPSAPPAYTL